MSASSDNNHASPKPGHRAIEVRVEELWELFDEIDPSPFGQRDLDPRADEFIVGWAREFPRDRALKLIVYLGRGPGKSNEEATLRDAIHQHFSQRVATARRRLRELFRRGRISLAIGLAFLAGSVALGDLIAGYLPQGGAAEILRTGLLIGGWVAMWRPLEIFLYDWWPIRADARLFARLSSMPVELVYQPSPEPKPPKPDWPEEPAYVPGGRRRPPAE